MSPSSSRAARSSALSDDAVQALLRSATLETAVKDISEIDGYAQEGAINLWDPSSSA